MTLDGFLSQLPDIDPQETAEWLESLDTVTSSQGKTRARYLLGRINAHARELQLGHSDVWTDYVNTIPTENQPFFPGDEFIERRIRAFIRWNAAAMVVRANKIADGIGGHLSTFASSASLYEVGFNHFFRGKEDGMPGDAIYFQGHAAPGIYARAFLEGRLDESQLDHFRMEVGGGGLSSYPHPRLMPDFWEYPTVSMGLGPINSIYHARFLKYLGNRHIEDTSESHVWAFLGDGETDEPETLGSISLAGRHGLDNLTWVINCNLQRLDGPVRGNEKIIQELEGVFRGAGWNVIKVVWGSRWDELLLRDTDGVLLNKMNTTVDGEFQRYAVESGAYIREHFFGPDPRLRKLVEHLSDDELRNLPRGGHDYQKVFAAYKAATEHKGQPTVILAKTVKGWTLGEGFEGRNATHQIKKMTKKQLLELRDRLYLHDEIPEDSLDDGVPPYYRPALDSPEWQYMTGRRKALDGPMPTRTTTVRRSLPLPSDAPFTTFYEGSGGRAVSTTMAFTSMLRELMREEGFGPRVVPIIPDEARTFGMDSMFREFEIYAPFGQKYEPVDHELLLSYTEDTDGQILEEGITEAGSMASWTAAATSYAHQGVPMVPFYTFYSMFGFQRIGDLAWAAADSRARGFLLGATAGRTTLMGEGLQHQDGHSLLLASTIPACQAYDPAFAYELAIIIRDGLQRMYVDNEDIFYYLTIYNENYEQPAMPAGCEQGILDGLYKFADGPEGPGVKATILFSGTGQGPAREAQTELAERWGVSAELWSVTNYKRLREEALDAERYNRLHPDGEWRTPLVTS
ncbi:MAG: pyruvate dehydrogenase (acetyl-transferring), homodimeric type, partial [Acidimicrobiales bacterium]